MTPYNIFKEPRNLQLHVLIRTEQIQDFMRGENNTNKHVLPYTPNCSIIRYLLYLIPIRE
jgi:hypothetical protein